MSKIDERWEANKQDLADAAAKAGIEPGLMAKIAGFESGYNPHARPIAGAKHAELNTVTQFDGTKAMSSAYGYGQFLDDTWVGMVHKYGEKYGVPNADKLTADQINSPEMRNNSKLQAGMLAEFTKTNMELGAKLGGPDADANVYALHNLGQGGGTKFLNALKADPDQRVDHVLSHKVIERNPGLYGDGSMTVAEAYKGMGQQMDKYAKYAQELDKGVPAKSATAPAAPGASTAKPEAPAAAPPKHPAPAGHAVLKEGDKGQDVSALQKQLHDLGYKGAAGKPLRVDGHYGPGTKGAVEAFQHDHHLKQDGEAGPLTQKQLQTQTRLHAQEQAGKPLLNQPGHPQHALYNQALDGVQKLGGGASAGQRENFAGSLAVEAQRNGLKKIDHVVLNDDGSRAWAVEGDLRSPFKQHAEVNVGQAVNTPLAQSSASSAQLQSAPGQEQAPQNQQQQQQQQLGSMSR
ncbi:XVIPCD domain-containing protein [Dyella marensis]|uniref:Putative peptidoglycan binding domain-containing protein n=1 Tax=Dyella marensis TaxID=500610 RepID=A0A1I2JW75_9GAMM|nr:MULTISPECIES: XVIPCD domain-containing protein [Dyella]SFF57297.1 Putative peptidoglycan binding domain-containing protein [Dyella marensis]